MGQEFQEFLKFSFVLLSSIQACMDDTYWYMYAAVC